MDKAAEKFLSKLSREKFWKYIDIKACLLKDSTDNMWKVGFININLLNESKVYHEKLPSFDNLVLIHEILRISELDEIVEQIVLGRQIRIGRINASLEWIGERLTYDFKMRAFVKQEYHIDEACHIIFKSGKYDEKIDRMIRRLEPLILEKGKTYRNLKDALISLLDVEFGTSAFSPFVRIFAPIYVKIEESKAEIRKLEILVSSAFEANLSKIRLRIFGEDESAQPTELRKHIGTFTRKEDSELLDRIVVVIDEKTRFAKLSLYYDEELLEDYYVRIPKLVVRQIIESVGVTETPPADRDRLRQRKQEIMGNYAKAKDENNSANVKGKLLEDVIKGIFELVPGLGIAGSRVTNEIQEIDIMVRNFNKTDVWADFGSVFFVECKNWFKGSKPGADKIRDFKGKLDNKNLKTGFFVAPNGIAEGKGGNKVHGINGQIDKYFQNGTTIIVLKDEDICDILNCRDVTEKINDKFMELYET
jgi:hypothetical protein